MPEKMVTMFEASTVFWILFAASQAFKIETSPEFRTIAQIGDSLSLTCSTTGCESPSFSWRTQIDSPLNGKVRNEGTKSVLTMDPVSVENEHSYLCTATCGSKKLEREIQVDIYSFPKDPEIQLSGHPEVGKPVMVKCLAPDVYPFDRLEMDLFKGDHLIKTQEFTEDTEKKSLETKSLEATFTPDIGDIGKALVCRAKLHIEHDSVPKERETIKELYVYTSPKNTVISVHPSTSLQEGDAVTMTCSSEGHPAPLISWSKKLDNGKAQLLSGNATLTLIAMRMEDSGTYECEGVNPVGRDKKEVELIVQEKPFTIDITPGSWVAAQIGDPVVLTCAAVGCDSPLFSWRTQIDSPLNGEVKDEGAKSTLTLSSVGFENEQSYLCTVTCMRRKLEKGIQVEVYSFPDDPEIEMSGPLVQGRPVTVNCTVHNVYPFDHLEIELLKGETMLKKEKFSEEMGIKSLETKSLETTFTPTSEDTGEVLVCLAKLHKGESEPKQRQSTQTLYVNVAPRETTIWVSPSSVLEEGSPVNLTCSSNGLPAPKIVWSRQLNNGELKPLSEDATLTLMSTKMEDSGIYVCEGINQAGISRESVELIVQGEHLSPKNIQLTVFPSESVKEGDTVIISCTCGNVPETWIILKKKAKTGDTVLKSVDGSYTILKAQLQDAGVYECESKTEVGSQLRSLTLDVKGRENNKDYFSPELLALYCVSSLIIPAIGTIIYFARKANMKGSYSLVEAQKSKV